MARRKFKNNHNYIIFDGVRGLYNMDDFGNAFRVFPVGILGRGLVQTYIRKGKI